MAARARAIILQDVNEVLADGDRLHFQYVRFKHVGYDDLDCTYRFMRSNSKGLRSLIGGAGLPDLDIGPRLIAKMRRIMKDIGGIQYPVVKD